MEKARDAERWWEESSKGATEVGAMHDGGGGARRLTVRGWSGAARTGPGRTATGPGVAARRERQGGGTTWLLVRVRKRREEVDTHGLNPLILSGQDTTAEIELFSAAVSGAAKNKLIFGGQIEPLKVSGYFWRLRSDRRK
jgi:hypothetical protein